MGTPSATGAIESVEDLNLLGAGASLTSPSVAVAKLFNGPLRAVLQALNSNSDSDLLSTPSILTLDNEEASIVAGQNVPFRTGSFTTNQSGANNPFTTIQREDVGITLRVIPLLISMKGIRCVLKSSAVSSVVNAGTIGEGGFSDIVTNKRTITTVILAEDAQTIVLGGLIQDDTQESVQRVPLFSAIPVAGKLFQNTSRERIKRNLLVFLRPTILRETEAVEAITTRKANGIWRVTPERKDQNRPTIDGYYDGRDPTTP